MQFLVSHCLDFCTTVGSKTLSLCSNTGSFVFFLTKSLSVLFTKKLNYKQTLETMESVGVGSFSIVFLTGAFTGLALALQSYSGFHRLGADEFIGLIVALGMVRELGPVLTGLMITGRCGSAMAAELGTLQITEQIDALKTLCIDPFQYLIVPRIVACTIMMPFLAVFSMICGISGGYFFCIHILGLNPETFMNVIIEHAQLSDILGGLIKSACFGFITSVIGTYQGYGTSGGARGVGMATTKSVVVGSIMILVANYFLSSILFQVGFS